jgi:CBS domain-containing protein
VLVKEVMARNLVTIKPEKSVYDASILYRDFKIGSLIVIENEKCIGILTERDIIERSICEKKDPMYTKVGDIMSSDIKTVHPLDTIEKALDTMFKFNIKKLPVQSNDEIIGIITVTDISKAKPDLSKRFMDTWVKPIWED